MHAEDFRVVLVGQAVDVLTNLGMSLVLRKAVFTRWREVVVFKVDDLVIVENLQDTHEEESVDIISDSATVVDLASHELHRVPWHLIILLQEVLQHSDGGGQIGI